MRSRVSGMVRYAFAIAFPVLVASCAENLPRLEHKVRYQVSMAGSLVEGTRTAVGQVTVIPSQEKFPGIKVVESGGSQQDASLSGWHGPLPKLDPSKIYQVELLTQIYRDPDYVFSDVLRISEGNHVVFDASICPKHKISMERLLERGVSACAYPRSFFRLQEGHFPYDGNAYLLCGSGLRHPTWKCPECEKAYYRWCKEHAVDPTW